MRKWLGQRGGSKRRLGAYPILGVLPQLMALLPIPSQAFHQQHNSIIVSRPTSKRPWKIVYRYPVSRIVVDALPPTGTCLAGSQNDEQETDSVFDSTTATNERQSFPSLASWAMIGLPFVSAIFPLLLQSARSLPANSSEQLLVVTALFVGNRAYLYAMATTIVALAAIRGAQDSSSLGQRIVDLTEELLYRPDLSPDASEYDLEPSDTTAEPTSANSSAAKETPKLIRNLRESGLERSLDEVSSETQALLLPLLVSFLLATSIFFLPFFQGQEGIGRGVETPDALMNLLQQYLPLVSQIWNAGILTVFSKSELRRLGYEFSILTTSSSNNMRSTGVAPLLEWGLATTIAAVACFLPIWPAQNFVNMALAILVARLIQLDRFPAIGAALCLLTLYDVTSVLFIPAAGAADVAMQAAVATTELASTNAIGSDILVAGSAGDSAMGSVAVQKLTSGTFQPGLLVTRIDKNNMLGGALGLGDAVFPSLLAAFVRRFDLEQMVQMNDDSNQLSLFAVSIRGYLVGCIACEFAPMISTSGLPALVFIFPVMLGSVLAAAGTSGSLTELWDYDPKEKSTV